MERKDSAVGDREEEDAKNPWVALALASFGILIYSLRYGGKPLRVNYHTGKVRVDDGSAAE